MAPNAVPKSPSNLTTKLKLKRKKSNKITQHILSQTGVCTEMLFLARTQKRVSHHSLEALYLRRMKINFCSVNGWNPPKYSCCVKLFREMEFLASPVSSHARWKNRYVSIQSLRVDDCVSKSCDLADVPTCESGHNDITCWEGQGIHSRVWLGLGINSQSDPDRKNVKMYNSEKLCEIAKLSKHHSCQVENGIWDVSKDRDVKSRVSDMWVVHKCNKCENQVVRCVGCSHPSLTADLHLDGRHPVSEPKLSTSGVNFYARGADET